MRRQKKKLVLARVRSCPFLWIVYIAITWSNLYHSRVKTLFWLKEKYNKRKRRSISYFRNRSIRSVISSLYVYLSFNHNLASFGGKRIYLMIFMKNARILNKSWIKFWISGNKSWIKSWIKSGYERTHGPSVEDKQLDSLSRSAVYEMGSITNIDNYSVRYIFLKKWNVRTTLLTPTVPVRASADE